MCHLDVFANYALAKMSWNSTVYDFLVDHSSIEKEYIFNIPDI